MSEHRVTHADLRIQSLLNRREIAMSELRDWFRLDLDDCFPAKLCRAIIYCVDAELQRVGYRDGESHDVD